MRITIIAAIAKNNALGKDNDLIWHLPADLKRFKKVTSGHHILMGRNTFESIGKPLPNRTTIIITRKKDYFVDGCLVANSIEEALEMVMNDNEIFIIGGAQIYEQVLEKDLADKLDITIVHQEFEADVFFPKIDKKVWKEIAREDFKADEKNKYDYSFVSYKKNIVFGSGLHFFEIAPGAEVSDDLPNQTWKFKGNLELELFKRLQKKEIIDIKFDFFADFRWTEIDIIKMKNSCNSEKYKSDTDAQKLLGILNKTDKELYAYCD